MLREKRQRFEELFSIPKEEQLLRDGWLTPFCWTYKARLISSHCKLFYLLCQMVASMVLTL
ncbi:hypothetical protein PAXRUDRAFT_148354 [Paxillus rubicundulus Ve08.2h10]|uniref:Unplaced genomic scaffold scaffold_508, whole genome shotgun sequence n=1 Tax=Paxillus rubicundulus Ve08.2h10 TaxID=930991 RepID=A0A0D0DYX7_9AGAM|nr:hypothetical protein PAXRUDRAFT_148354 [Paxillus rubicundulus Ve08.2h10]